MVVAPLRKMRRSNVTGRPRPMFELMYRIRSRLPAPWITTVAPAAARIVNPRCLSAMAKPFDGGVYVPAASSMMPPFGTWSMAVCKLPMSLGT